MDWQVGHSGKCQRTRLHKVEKMLNYEYAELRNVYIKELTLKLWIYQKCIVFFDISTHCFRKLTVRFNHTVPELKNLASPPLYLAISCSYNPLQSNSIQSNHILTFILTLFCSMACNISRASSHAIPTIRKTWLQGEACKWAYA